MDVLAPLNQIMECGLLSNGDGKLLLLYDQDLPHELDYLEYDDLEYTLYLIYQNGIMQDSGLKISEDIADNLSAGTEFILARMQDKKIISYQKAHFVFKDM